MRLSASDSRGSPADATALCQRDISPLPSGSTSTRCMPPTNGADAGMLVPLSADWGY
jgi:hypothetical protein